MSTPCENPGTVDTVTKAFKHESFTLAPINSIIKGIVKRLTESHNLLKARS